MIHIDAKGKIEKTVLMPGDPLRAKYIAEKYLENVELINEVRNMLAFSGEYKGKRITVMGSGMGMPSMGIYAYELFKGFDVENIIRIGSCGSINKDVRLRDVVLVDKSYNEGNFAKNLTNEENHISDSNSELNNLIIETYNENYSNEFDLKLGNICTTECFDAYITEPQKFWDRIPEGLNILGCEMESFALFETAKLFGRKAACLLTVVDASYTDKKLTTEEREKDLDNMIVLALEAAIKI